MQLRLGPIPTNLDFSPESGGWRPLREPSPWVFQLLALPVALATLVLFLKAWTRLVGEPVGSADTSRALLAAGPLFFAIVPLHELIHGLCHPHWGRTRASIYGFWPSKVLFYAHYDGALSRNRFVGILLAPLGLLSIAPLLASSLLGVGHWLVFTAAVLNLLAACGDLTAILLVLSQVPGTATVRNLGYYTWWTEPQ
jgi:hypothetical protein